MTKPLQNTGTNCWPGILPIINPYLAIVLGVAAAASIFTNLPTPHQQ